jgi:hypothetical protein
MIDRRDFDEWWARELARNGGEAIGADYRHWAEAGFMAAAKLMSQHLKAQKQRAKAQPERQPGYSVSMSGYIRTLAKDHEANLPAPQLARLLVRQAGKP